MWNTKKKSFESFPLAPPNLTKGKPMKKLTKEQKRDIAAIAAKRDVGIDFSDAAPVLDWSGAEMGKFHRPEKRPVTMRLDCDVIEWLKSEGPGYQTKANGLLRHAMLHYTNGKSASIHKRSERRATLRRRKGKA
jgi:uncharacterized protein (DUF4415 family)